jgi:hypothetical protein
MKSHAADDFWVLFRRLPPEVKKQAYKAYRQWKNDPRASGLRFKRVSVTEPIYSVRIGRGYRALGYLDGGTIYWYWIGKHADYDRELNSIQ